VAPLVLLGAMVALAGCAGSPKQQHADVGDGPPDARPKIEPKSRYGNMHSYVVFGRRYHTKASSRDHVERGLASWYGRKFHGRKTSSGERYDMHRMTAAHKTLPLPTYALVTNLDNGRRAVVKVNDRGPFVGGRVIDLSYAAAKRLDMLDAGTARVEVRSVDPRDHGGIDEARRLLAANAAVPSRREPPPPDQAQPAVRNTIYLQVGAFGSRTSAEQLRHQLVAAVEEPVLVKEPAASAAQAPLYKVQVGPFASDREADALGRRLAALGIDRPLLVRP
jgi:rare lipoprotein A